MPATAPLKTTGVDAVPVHTVWLAIAATVGVGFTVMAKLAGVPAQALAVGVTVMVPVIADALPFVAVKAAILPEPEVTRPIAVLLFVQV